MVATCDKDLKRRIRKGEREEYASGWMGGGRARWGHSGSRSWRRGRGQQCCRSSLHFDSSLCVRILFHFYSAASSARCAHHVHHATQVQHRAIRGRERRAPTGMRLALAAASLPPLLCLLSVRSFFSTHICIRMFNISSHDRFACRNRSRHARGARGVGWGAITLGEKKFKSLRLYLPCANRDVSSMLTKLCTTASHYEPLRAMPRGP